MYQQIFWAGYQREPSVSESPMSVKVFQQSGKLALVSWLSFFFKQSISNGVFEVLSYILSIADVPICGRDILGDLRLKEVVKAHT